MDLRGWLSLALAVAVIHLVLILPNHPGAMTWGALRMLPLELPVILILLSITRGAAGAAVRVAATAFLTAMPVIKLADYGAFLAYNRMFNPILDAHLLPAAFRLATGAIGLVPTAAAALAGGLAILLLARLLWWATGRVQALAPRGAARAALALALLPAGAAVAADVERGWAPVPPPGSAFTARLARSHVERLAAMRGDLARFRAEAERDAFAHVPPELLLADLAGTDVVIVYVESYGRSALENARYAGRVRARLEAIERDLAAAGLEARSAFATAPMTGGQSWLAHASIASGLWIDNQRRYQALLTSPRRTLFHYAAAAGWRTVAVMPAITLAWPEADYFGFEEVHAAADLGYSGLPFNWVTMPDQFTLRAFERLEMERPARRPLFAQVALISSHAPWTPVPPLLPWEAIGDGTEFDEIAVSGDPPEVVWRDRDRVRAQYLEAVDYALEAAGSFMARHGGADAPLFIVLGDHEPASFVAESESFDAPVHVVGTPETLARLDGLGLMDGLVPGEGAPVWRMDEFRDRFLAAVTPGMARTAGDAEASGGGASPATPAVTR